MIFYMRLFFKNNANLHKKREILSKFARLFVVLDTMS